MPHDVNGKLIQAGDEVSVPCVVESVTTAGDYCNVTLKTKYSMPPYEHKDTLTLNTKQIIKAE